MMWSFAVLGRIALTGDDGADLDELLRQPKRLALLAYLCLPSTGTWHRRDDLVARFWPEFDSQRARTALRNAIYVLRKALGDEVIRGRGDEEVSVDPARLTCDAADLLDDFGAGRDAVALERYRGDLLSGLFVPDAAPFEEWLEQERRRLRALAHDTAARRATALEAQGDLAGAVRAARRALELDGHDEAMLGRLLTLMDKSGDRAGALTEFERFRARLQSELDVEPSPETVTLVARMRERDSVTPSEARGRSSGLRQAPSVAALPQGDTPSVASGHRRAMRWAIAGVAAVAVGAIGLAALQTANRGDDNSLLILPMQHQAGADSLRILAAGLTADFNERLHRVAGISLRAAGDTRGDLGTDELIRTARAAGARLVLSSTLTPIQDSLALQLMLRDDDGTAVWSASFSTHPDLLEATSSRVTAAIAGRLLGRPLPPGNQHTVDPESYRLTLQGLQHLMLIEGGTNAAYPKFLRAVEIDPTNARAWTGISSVWTSRGFIGRVAPPEDAFTRGEDAARKALALDSAQGMAWGNLGVIKAARDGDFKAGEALFRRGMALEPSNAELYQVLSALYRFAGQNDRSIDEIRIAQRLHPLSPVMIEREGFAEYCAGRHERALEAYRRLQLLDPARAAGFRGAARSLAALSRWDEAIDKWKASPAVERNPELRDILATARGKEGYLAAARAEGRELLATTRRQQAEGWVAPYHIAVGLLRSGAVDSGLALLEQEIDRGASGVYRVHCMEGTVELRTIPAFQALMRRVPLLGGAAAGR